MGNQQKVVSRFSDQNKWLPLAQTSRKELIQNKLSREIVEKHFLKNIEWEEVKQDGIIFDWRKDLKTSLYCIELFQIKKINEVQQQNYCLGNCHTSQTETDLIVYTQHIFKLYEQNPKCQLDEKDQMTIFKGIIQGVDMLSKKFGEFCITKDMVGYNSSKRGKAWINQNFCMNKVLKKRVIRTPEDRFKWEKQVIDDLLNLCKLCSIDKNIRNCKFFHVMELIMSQRLYKFSAFRQFGPFKDIDLSQGVTSRDIRKTQQASSGHSNELRSIDGKNRFNEKQKRVNIFSKTFDFPLIKVHEPERNMTTMEGYHRIAYEVLPNNQNITLGGQGRKQPIRSPVPQPVVVPNNYVEIRNNNHMNGNQTFLNDANDYNKKHKKRYPPSREAGQKQPKKPEHYAILDEMQQSRSSRDSDKMINKEMIKMVDSMMMVENKQSSDNDRPYNNNKIYLEESVIVRAPQNRS